MNAKHYLIKPALLLGLTLLLAALTACGGFSDASSDTGAPENVLFTVDITDNLLPAENIIIGNTTNAEAYSGEIEIHLDDPLLDAAGEIEPGSTYVFTVTPMMTMSIPPQVTATAFTAATEADIEAMEETRGQISNYTECMERYQSMSLEEIIEDANFSYTTWTQEEIADYNAFLEEKGYVEGKSGVSYVRLREELQGSVFAADGY